MRDDAWIQSMCDGGRMLLVLAEVKAGRCRVNGPWSREHEANMNRAISRLGMAATDTKVGAIAAEMYRSLHWKDDRYVLQYVSVGSHRNDQLRARYPSLVQVTWKDISRFLFARFKEFPEKVNVRRPVHPQWPHFGRAYAEFATGASRADSEKAVTRYIRTGSLT